MGFLDKWHESRAEKKARWEEIRQELDDGALITVGRYHGGSVEITGLEPTKEYTLHIGPDKFTARNREETVLEIPWNRVIEVVVGDAAHVMSKTKVSNHSYGWFGGVFKTMPVAGTTQRARSFMTIASDAGDVLFEMPWEGGTLEGRLLSTKHLWRGADSTSSPPSDSPNRLDELKKLTELRDAGALSPEEFAAEKARILDRP